MNIEELKRIIQKSGIDPKVFRMNENVEYESVLYLNEVKEARKWEILQNERGIYIIHEVFNTEDEACRFFLKELVAHPSVFLDYNGKNYYELLNKGNQILRDARATISQQGTQGC